MSNQVWLFIALGIYFAAMLLIGYLAYRRTSSHEDYMLGGRNLPPWVAALSAGASDMSGWLIMGLPGAIYLAGLIEAWIAVGLTLGAYFNWLIVAPRLRAYTQVAQNSITIPSYFENRLRDKSRLLRVVSSIIILIFFTLYVSSGMVAGGVFFQSSFNGDYLWGMIIVTVVTLAYTLFGGFLGASLTDVVQGLEDVSKYPDLTAELMKRGYTDADLKKILGLNVLRVMRQVEKVAAGLQKTRQPSTATIESLDGKVQ